MGRDAANRLDGAAWEPDMTLGRTRERLLNRIAIQLIDKAVRLHRTDLKLLASQELISGIKEELRQRREGCDGVAPASAAA
jgi:hypothetical protein